MAGTVLKNIIAFTGLTTGVPVTLPHLLTLNTDPVPPNLIAANAAGFSISATATTLTVTRQASATTGNVEIYVEQWHTFETVEPPAGLSAFFPFIISGGGSSGSAPLTPAFIYIANGSENMAGFPVPFPSGPRGGVPYVAIVQVALYQAGGLPNANAPPGDYTDSEITVTVAAPSLLAGDMIAVHIIDA